ncbi:MAG: hypothetical protein R6U63_14655 [Longimicrobiales bacterium]
MDLFEILFIALFILFPIMEGILKKRRKPEDSEPGEGSGAEADADWSAPDEEPRAASDMVPDDLWEVMTGEKRRAGAGGGAEGERGVQRSMEPEESPEPVREHAGPDTAAEAPEDWRSAPWVVDEETEEHEPVSAEYRGPEAYSLETPAPPPLEREVPTSEARHRAFHRLLDRPKPERKRRLSPLMRSLRSPDGLRQAVLLKEILGPPKGLE